MVVGVATIVAEPEPGLPLYHPGKLIPQYGTVDTYSPTIIHVSRQHVKRPIKNIGYGYGISGDYGYGGYAGLGGYGANVGYGYLGSQGIGYGGYSGYGNYGSIGKHGYGYGR